MRIDSLDILAYGSFTNKSLDLSQGDFGLHLIYGDNEAGKSTALRALIAWLFGIPHRTDDNFLYPNSELRIGGVIKNRFGKKLHFIRKKGRGRTLLASDGITPIDDQKLLNILPGGIDEKLFTKMYGIDHGRLIAGGDELLNQSGDLGQALFSAAAGTENMHHILMDLHKNADDIFSSRAHVKPLNQSIKNYKTTLNKVEELSLNVNEWKKLKEDLSYVEDKIQDIDHKINTKSIRKKILERQKRIRSVLERRNDLIDKLKNFEQISILPDEFNEERKSAVQNINISINQIKKAKMRLDQLEMNKKSLIIRNELIDNENAISSMCRRMNEIVKSKKDRENLITEYKLLKDQRENLLKAISSDLKDDDVCRMRAMLKNKKYMQKLVKEHDFISLQMDDAKSRLFELQEIRKEKSKKISNLGPWNPDLTYLKAKLSEVRKKGDIEKHLLEAEKRINEALLECEDQIKRLKGFNGSAGELKKLSLPLPATYDIFEKKFDKFEEILRDYGKKKKELENQHKKSVQSLNILLSSDDIPSIDELDLIRQNRDKIWYYIKNKYIKKNENYKAIDLDTQDQDIAGFYEKKVRSSDTYSDRLRSEADKVVKRANLDIDIKRAETDIKDIEDCIKIEEENYFHLNKEWEDIWHPLGINHGTPREMKQWVIKAEKIISDIDIVDKTQIEHSKLSDEYAKAKEILSEIMKSFNKKPDNAFIGLDAMISCCEKDLDDAESINEEIKHLKDSMIDTDLGIEKAEKKIADLEAKGIEWKKKWENITEGLDIESEDHPYLAIERLENLSEYFTKHDKATEKNVKIQEIKDNEEEFEKEVNYLLNDIGIKEDHKDIYEMVEKINNDLNSNKADLIRSNELDKQITELRGQIKDYEIDLKAEEDKLSIMRNKAGVHNNDQLESICIESDNKRILLNELHQREEEIKRNSDGLLFKELEKEANNIDRNLIDSELESVFREIKLINEKRDELRDEKQTIIGKIDRVDGNYAAAEASEDAEQILAEIKIQVESYLKLKTAALILEQEIEKYRRKNQGPVLKKASVIFSQLTLGSFIDLRDDLDKNGKPIIIGIRPNNDEIMVSGMSDGTRDQLYLALRLGTLYQYLENGEPIPFIADDILIGFDDRRSRECLKILTDLASKTQVMLFTHHKRILDLAFALNKKSEIFIHSLNH